MPEEIKTYRTRDGQEFTKLKHAGYREQLLDLREAAANAKDKLRKFADKCTHPEYEQVGTRLDFRETDQLDEFDRRMSEQVERVLYKCKCCGAAGYRWVDREKILFYAPMNPMWDS